ncbi:MAG TPA: TlpA disulfide reductase family protein [Kofleriaceae bacterium]|nr:TlpA disulfide reductase family protein [Kofleriaceae bacterium]
MYGRALLVCSLGILGACKKESAPPATTPAVTAAKPPAAEPGTWYRARLVFDGVGDLPFFLHVPPVGKSGRAYVVNGDENAEFQAEWRDNEISVTGPWTYTSVIEAQLVKPSGALEGTWTRDTPLWGAVVRNFVATPIAAPDPRTRFAGSEAPAVSVAGTWQFKFEQHQDGKGVLEQTADGVLHGYVKPGQLGDIRFLAGNLHGGKLALSQFNGNAANLVLADVAADGMSMSGTMSMQNVWNEKFTATKVADYRFVNKVHLKEGNQTVSLKGLDKYRGKPTLAIIFATWCSSCNDAYPVFKQLYASYHAQGLEVLGVAYDLSDDEKSNQAQLDSFRAKHQIPWELVQVPCTPETWAKAMPPEIEGWDGLPIILLVRPDGTVQTVFGGWFGPATGADGEQLRKSFEDSVRDLVAAAKRPT